MDASRQGTADKNLRTIACVIVPADGSGLSHRVYQCCARQVAYPARWRAASHIAQCNPALQRGEETLFCLQDDFFRYLAAPKPSIRLASQARIVVKYAGTNRCNDAISALLPTLASSCM
jgi:hypothetical protein